MDDTPDEKPRDEPEPGSAPAPTPEEPKPAPRPRSRPRIRRAHLILAWVVMIPLLLFAIWAAVSLNYTYSTGSRAGYVQKISKKGWLCKTWEGELAMVNLPGAMPQIFKFSVRSDSLAREIERTQGNRVSLHYEQHPGVPRCFGETDYFVTRVRAME